MIDTMDASAAAVRLLRTGRALVERLAAGRVDVPSTEAAGEWVESLTSQLPAAAALAAVEHLFGLLPLVDAYFEPLGGIAEVAAGRQLGCLGLFTPTPELRWDAAAVAGEPSGGAVVLRGDVLLPSPASDGSLVLVRLDGGEHRLAWVGHDARGAELCGSRRGGPVRADAPCWLVLAGAAVGADLVSRPVTLAPGGGYVERLEAYAGVWALAAALCAGDGVRALRRAARTTQHRGQAWSASQLVAMEVTALEIEAELAAAAARLHLAHAANAAGGRARCGGAGALAVAAAAARALYAVAAKERELRDSVGLEAGLELDGQPASGLAAVTAFLGGPLMVESELGRGLGLRAQEARE